MSAVSHRSQRSCALLLTLPLSLSALALPALPISAQDAPPASEHAHADHSEHAASAAGPDHADHASSAQDAETQAAPAEHARHGHDHSAHADSTSAAAANASLPAAPSAEALPGTAPPAPSLYVCPMHPQITSETPGSCPICGMDLVARSRSAAQAAPVIEVDAGLRQALGIRTAEVDRRVLSPRVRAPAEVVADQHRIRHVHTRVSGWVEDLRVHALGERVQGFLTRRAL